MNDRTFGQEAAPSEAKRLYREILKVIRPDRSATAEELAAAKEALAAAEDGDDSRLRELHGRICGPEGTTNDEFIYEKDLQLKKAPRVGGRLDTSV